MEIERRERDPDTGEIVGEGFSDVFAKIAAKLTGKTAKKLATKAAEKLVEKGAEKIGEKTGQLVGEKIYEKFSAKPSEARDASRPAEAEGPGRSERPKGASERSESGATEDRPPETKGKEIGKMLAASSPPAEAKIAPEKVTGRTFKKINNVYADLL